MFIDPTTEINTLPASHRLSTLCFLALPVLKKGLALLSFWDRGKTLGCCCCCCILFVFFFKQSQLSLAQHVQHVHTISDQVRVRKTCHLQHVGS